MTEHQRISWLISFYPTTIIHDRYSGTYSGGKFVAFPLSFDAIPEAVAGGDGECAAYWAEADQSTYGLGASPEAAFKDLKAKMGRLIDACEV